MVSTTHHVTAHSKPAQSHAIGQANVPETDSFDFMSYLLGLQVGAKPDSILSESDNDVETPILPGKKLEAASEDPLMSIFGKKKNPSWNPMFPNGLPTAPAVGHQMNVDSLTKFSSENPNTPQMAANRQQIAIPQIKAEQQANAPAATDPKLINAASVAGEMQTGEPAKPIRSDSHSKVHENKPLFAETEGSEQVEVKGVPSSGKATELNSKLAVRDEQGSAGDTRSLVDSQKHVKVQAQGGSNEAMTAANVHALQPKGDTLETKKSEHRRDSVDTLSALGLGSTPGAKPSDGATTASVTQTPNQNTVPELFSKVESMVHNGGGKMTVSLTPPHLGKVEIQVTTRGKKVEIEINSQNDLAKSVLESKLGDLKQSLHTHDLQLSKVEVQVSKDLARPFSSQSFATLAGGNNAYQQQQSQGAWNQSQTGRPFGQESSRSTNPTPGRLRSESARHDGGTSSREK